MNKIERAKPILFNTEMVRAILDGHKTVTRRVVKPQPSSECDHGGQHEFIRDDFIEESIFTGFVCKKCGHGVCGPHFKFPIGTSWIRPPYRPGDLLYVRETWCDPSGTGYPFLYKADMPMHWEAKDTEIGIPVDLKAEDYTWRPSIHMPRKAARIFLRVTDVRAERLKDITDADARAEGIGATDVIYYNGALRCDFMELWNSTIKPSDRAIYGWEANPWVWVIEFDKPLGRGDI